MESSQPSLPPHDWQTPHPVRTWTYWRRKFSCAGRGWLRGMQGQASFFVHGIMGVAVVLLAACLQMSLVEWSLLILCIISVLAAELFNSALEYLAQAVDKEYNEQLRDALDCASGAVLIVAVGAACVGLLMFGNRLLELLA
ncbi:Diacylglycerol kinase [Planctomycetales bacterium 10988]|nr:Diacylglycerol kinase [Planctomycetales bacterium 10988]